MTNVDLPWPILTNERENFHKWQKRLNVKLALANLFTPCMLFPPYRHKKYKNYVKSAAIPNPVVVYCGTLFPLYWNLLSLAMTCFGTLVHMVHLKKIFFFSFFHVYQLDHVDHLCDSNGLQSWQSGPKCTTYVLSTVYKILDTQISVDFSSFWTKVQKFSEHWTKVQKTLSQKGYNFTIYFLM